MRAVKAIIYILGFRLFLAPLSLAADDPPEKLILDSLEAYSTYVSSQKVYLHTDKDSYRSGQTIWFRAYLLDGITNVPVMGMNNLFVDLIDWRGESVAVRLLLSSEGGAHGDIALDSGLPDGNYILRAYTSWMKNFGEEYYFTMPLYIRNPGYENRIRRIDVLRNRLFNRRIERKSNDYEVGFFPEGGNLVAGIVNRVAFKVADQLGRGHYAEGEVIDDEGNVIASLKTDVAGIGVFEIKPVSGNDYLAAISINGSKKRYRLPESSESGYALRIDQSDGKINIRLEAAMESEKDIDREAIIIGHTRGEIHFAATYPLGNEALEVDIDKELFPSGIAHFTVFTGDYRPVAERLVFINRNDMLRFSANVDTVVIFERDYLSFTLDVKDSRGNFVEGTFSLSAVTGKPDQMAYSPGILSYILFSSDLGGMVEHPDLYIENSQDDLLAADHLLLTYGWRRFKWEDVLAGEMPRINYSGQPGLAIAGRVMDPASKNPIGDHPLFLKVKNGYDHELRTTSNDRGYFAFPGLYYEGVVRMELSGRRIGTNYPPEIELNVSEPWGYDAEPGIYTRKRQITSRGEDWQRQRRQQASYYTASPGRIAAAQEFGRPSQTIFLDHDEMIEHNVLEVLQNKAVGLIVEGNYVRLSGLTTLYGRAEVEYMINGRFVEKNWFIGTPVRDIERLEIFRHSSTAAFGSRGGSGVIIAYTKEPGYTGMVDVLRLNVQGYHEVRDFYTDILYYEKKPVDPEIERTIYWEPRLATGQDGVVNFLLPVDQDAGYLNVVIQGAGFDGSLGYLRIFLED